MGVGAAIVIAIVVAGGAFTLYQKLGELIELQRESLIELQRIKKALGK